MHAFPLNHSLLEVPEDCLREENVGESLQLLLTWSDLAWLSLNFHGTPAEFILGLLVVHQ